MNNHILLLSRSTPFHNIGGMEMISWDLAKSLADRGCRVTLLTTSIPNRNDEFIKEKVSVVPLKYTKPMQYTHKWWEESRKYVEKHLLSSITGVISVSAAGFSILPLKNQKKIPFIMQAHGTSIGEIQSKWRSKKPGAILKSIKNMPWILKDIIAYRQFDKIVCVGDTVYNSLTTWPYSSFLEKNKVITIYNGIDTKLFYPDDLHRFEIRQSLGFDNEMNIIISSSRLHSQKGVEYSIRGFAEFVKKEPNSIYIILGDGPERNNLELLTKQLGIENKIKFIGGLQRSEVANYLRISDVFLFTTLHSEVGLPLNTLEAAASGLPLVISDHLDFKIDEIQSIIKVNPMNTKHIAEAIALLLKEKKTNSLPMYYSLDYMVEQYISLLQI